MSKNSERLILVTGATGKQGGAAFQHLRRRGFPIRALTRNIDKPEARALIGKGVEIAQGDLTDLASVSKALEDVYGVYSVQDWRSGADAEIQEGINLADAANRAGVRHLVYSSVGSAEKNTGIPHFESKFKIEEHIRATGIHYTILRPVYFMENWLWIKEQIDQGTLAQPLSPDTRLQMIAVDDIGGFVATAFEHPGRWDNRALDIAGDDLSMSELAAAFGRAGGKEVQYVQVPWDKFEQEAGPEMAVMYRWFEEVGYHVDIGAVRAEYPTLTGFEKWLNAHWHATSGAQA